MKSTVVVMSVLSIVISLVVIIPGSTEATYYDAVNVPGAQDIISGGDSGVVPGAVNAGDYLYANETATLGGIPLPPGHGYATQWIQTRDFRAGVWNNQYHTARDISLPPNSATIAFVYLDIRWQDPNPIWGGDGTSNIPDYEPGFSLDGGVTWTWTAFRSARIADGTPADDCWDAVNVTGLASWTPQILKSSLLCVKMISYSYQVSPPYYCELDYLGIYYMWSGPDPPEESQMNPGEYTPGVMEIPDVMGLMGITGFIGMIGIPAASIWFLRRDGGSKIHAGVMALIGFTVCFGFFLASINGG
jgi:hypothetical protein